MFFLLFLWIVDSSTDNFLRVRVHSSTPGEKIEKIFSSCLRRSERAASRPRCSQLCSRLFHLFQGPLILFPCEGWKTFGRFSRKRLDQCPRGLGVSFRAILCGGKKGLTASLSKPDIRSPTGQTRSRSHSNYYAKSIQDKLIQCFVSIATTSFAACCAVNGTARTASSSAVTLNPKHV